MKASRPKVCGGRAVLGEEQVLKGAGAGESARNGGRHAELDKQGDEDES